MPVAGWNSAILSGSTRIAVTGGTFDVKTEDIDTTNTEGQGWQDSIDGTKVITGSFDFHYDPNKSPFSDITKLLPGRSTTEFPTLTLYYSATEYWTGPARVQTVSVKSAAKSDGITMTVSFTSKGLWTQGP
jgi:hypothetical protein